MQASRLLEPDYKLGVAHAAAEPDPGPAEQQVVLAAGEPWLQAATWYAHWQAWLAGQELDDAVRDEAMDVLIDHQAVWFTRSLPPGCRWAYLAGEIVGPAGTVLPPALGTVMEDVALETRNAETELLEELFAEAQ